MDHGPDHPRERRQHHHLTGKHRRGPGTIRRVDDSTTVPTTAVEGAPAPLTSTTLIGPNGTAPGMNFVEQQQQPVLDAQTGRAAGAPLAVAALILLVVFTSVFVRAARARRRRAETAPDSLPVD